MPGLQGNRVEITTDPVVQREVVEREPRRHLHDRRQQQSEEWQAHAQQKDRGGESRRRQAHAAKPALPVHRPFRTNRDEPASLAHQPRIDPQSDDAYQHDRAGDYPGDARLARGDAAEERRRKNFELDRQAKHIGHAEFSQALGEDEHHRGEQCRAHQGQDDLQRHLVALGTEDACRILELGIEAPERRAEQENDEGRVVQREDDGDRKPAIGEPVGRCQPRRFQPSGLAADRTVLEERRPGEREGPGRQHVGHDQRGREPAAPEHVRSAYEPGKHSADQQRERYGAHGNGERVEKRAPEQVRRHRREQRSVEIIEREIADILAQAPLVPELHANGVEHDGNDRNDDQVREQQRRQNTDQGRGFTQGNLQPIAPCLPGRRRGRPGFSRRRLCRFT